MSCRIRPEHPDDVAAIRAVNVAAFPSDREAVLVDRLRGSVEPWWSFVAELDDAIVGHLLFSPVNLDPVPRKALRVFGLGPMAVHPEAQGRGIGSTLVDVGLETVARDGADAVVVLGHPEWYPRFGFEPARHHGLSLAMDVPSEAFLVKEFTFGCLPEDAVVHYLPEFS